MGRAAKTFLVLTCIWSLPATARAQGSVTGVVKDSSGAVLPGVTAEASSLALAEGFRSATTDATGRYRIADLPPGTYALTFELQGFTKFRRQGLALTDEATLTVDAELRVGDLREPLTIVDYASLVDVYTVRRETTMYGDVLRDLPMARSYGAIVQLMPSVQIQASLTPSGRNGQIAPALIVFGGPGGRDNEGRLQVDGLDVGASINATGVSAYVADVANAWEVTLTDSGGLGEAEVGGPKINIVPKTGSNRLGGEFHAASMSDAMVSGNQSLHLWDLSGSLSGPIVKDRLWYLASVRNEGSLQSVSGMFANKNAGDPTKRNYEADLSRPSRAASSFTIQNLRLTAQITPRNKISVFWDEQRPCAGATWSADTQGCRQQATSGFIYGGTARFAPEAGGTLANGTSGGYDHGFQRVQQVTLSSSTTARLLFEVGLGAYMSRFGSNEAPGNPTRDLVQVTERCATSCPVNANIPDLTFRAMDWESNWSGAYTWRASASYVTGSHMAKFGYQGAFHAYDPVTFTNNEALSYQVDNGVPVELTERLSPFERKDRTRSDALYAQDQWTIARMTLQGALRYDDSRSYFPEQRVGGTRFLLTPLTFPETRGVTGLHDLTPRVGAVFALGDGDTAVKVNAGKYLEASGALGIYSATNPVARISSSGSRAWTDANDNFVPDCDLVSKAAQDSRASGGDACGALNPQTFGSGVFASTIDPQVLGGWGVRSGDWQVGASIQQLLRRNLAVEVGYYRRWLLNLLATDNRAAAPADFEEFSLTAPSDSRLPGGGGYLVTSLYNLEPAKFGRTDNLTTSASTFGTAYQRYDGVLMTVYVQPRHRLTVHGGINVGKTVSDLCEIRDQLPELTVTDTIGPTSPYCHSGPGWVTRASGLAAYTIPRIDVLVSGTFRSDPGLPLSAFYSVPNAVVAQSLGRLPTSTTPFVTVNLVAPGQVWGDRVNEINLRVAKVVRVGRTRTSVGVDIYNLLNTSAVLDYDQTYVPNGTWLMPTLQLTSRFAKISVTLGF